MRKGKLTDHLRSWWDYHEHLKMTLILSINTQGECATNFTLTTISEYRAPAVNVQPILHDPPSCYDQDH